MHLVVTPHLQWPQWQQQQVACALWLLLVVVAGSHAVTPAAAAGAAVVVYVSPAGSDSAACGSIATAPCASLNASLTQAQGAASPSYTTLRLLLPAPACAAPVHGDYDFAINATLQLANVTIQAFNNQCARKPVLRCLQPVTAFEVSTVASATLHGLRVVGCGPGYVPSVGGGATAATAATLHPGRDGGVLRITPHPQPIAVTINDCEFDGNSAMRGAVVAAAGAARVQFTNCSFTNNWAGQAGGVSLGVQEARIDFDSCWFGDAAMPGTHLPPLSCEHTQSAAFPPDDGTSASACNATNPGVTLTLPNATATQRIYHRKGGADPTCLWRLRAPTGSALRLVFCDNSWGAPFAFSSCTASGLVVHARDPSSGLTLCVSPLPPLANVLVLASSKPLTSRSCLLTLAFSYKGCGIALPIVSPSGAMDLSITLGNVLYDTDFSASISATSANGATYNTSFGGSMALFNASSTSITDTTIAGSAAGGGGGGFALLANQASLTTSGNAVHLSHCSVTGGEGGALLVQDTAQVLLQATNLSQCVADTGGLAALTGGASFRAVGAVWLARGQALRAGAIAASGTAAVMLERATIASHTVSSTAGALWIRESATVDATHCTFTENAAPASSGGAVLLGDDAQARFQACTFHANAADFGAGVYISGSARTNTTECTFTANVANRFGGALHTTQAAGLVDRNSYYADNRASKGAVLALGQSGAEPATATFINTTAAYNTAQNGGVVSVPFGGGAVLTIRNCTMQHNTALSLGGAGGVIDVAGRGISIAVTDTVLRYNSAAVGGGGVMRLRGQSRSSPLNQATFTRVIMQYNSAGSTTSGGGVMALDGSLGGSIDVTLRACTVSHNTAKAKAAVASINSNVLFTGKGGPAPLEQQTRSVN